MANHKSSHEVPLVSDMPKSTSSQVQFSYPIGVRLLNNVLGRSNRPLVVEELLDAARKKSGLSDFGDDFFLASLSKVVEDVNASCDFHPLGAFLYRNKIILNLSNRLWAQYWLKKRPEIAQPLPPALLITGLQRTGTTFLQRLLGALPEFRGVISWEIVNPVPTSQKQNYYGKYQARAGHKALNYINPDFKTIHSVDYDSLEEEVVLMEHSFMSSVLEACMNVPNYALWLEKQDQKPAYRDLKMWLQFLLWRKPASKYLLLKSPHHMEYLDDFIQVFPNVKIVHTHRDPAKTIGSFCSMVEEGHKIFQPSVDREHIGQHWIRKNKRLIEKCEAFKSSHQNMFTDIAYRDLVNDPLAVAKQLYNLMETEWTNDHEWKADAFCTEHRKNKYGKHVYSLEKYGLSQSDIDEHFGDYLRKYKDYLTT